MITMGIAALNPSYDWLLSPSGGNSSLQQFTLAPSLADFLLITSR